MTLMKQLRIDDVGASTKAYNQYGRSRLTSIGFFKRLPPFQGWGPYAELDATAWRRWLTFFGSRGIRPLIAVTACWVDAASRLIPFPEKFPEAAAVLRAALSDGYITIANHGLTHCVVGRHLPLFWSGNRRWHREFWPELPATLHREHICRSQEILEGYFGQPITTFVPPGNIWSRKTAAAFEGTHLQRVVANRPMADAIELTPTIDFVDDRDIFVVLHDRDLHSVTPAWIETRLR
jgi:uncharacterized protein DUF2334